MILALPALRGIDYYFPIIKPPDGEAHRRLRLAAPEYLAVEPLEPSDPRGFFDPTIPARMLVSDHRGLFLWTPLTAAAALGFALAFVRARRTGEHARFLNALLAASLALLCIHVFWPRWDGGFTFSQRFLTGLFPLYLIGIAELVRRARWWVYPALVLAASFAVWVALVRDVGYDAISERDDLSTRGRGGLAEAPPVAARRAGRRWGSLGLPDWAPARARHGVHRPGEDRMLTAGFLSMLVPGAGQLYRGAHRRGLVLLSLTAGLLLGVLALATWGSLDTIDRRLVALLLGLNLALLALRLFAVVDASRGGWAVGVTALVALTAAPHLAAGYVTVRGYHTLETVFADKEPPCGTACDRGASCSSTRAVPLPEWVPKDAWEWALVERLGPGEVAPLERGTRVLAGTKPSSRIHGRRSSCSAPTRGRATSAPAPTRSSSSPRSTAPGGRSRSASRATSPRFRSVPTRSRSRSR